MDKKTKCLFFMEFLSTLYSAAVALNFILEINPSERNNKIIQFKLKLNSVENCRRIKLVGKINFVT